jgi:hypothetical protein
MSNLKMVYILLVSLSLSFIISRFLVILYFRLHNGIEKRLLYLLIQIILERIFANANVTDSEYLRICNCGQL